MSSQVGEGLVKLLQVKSSWDWFIQTGRSSQKSFGPKTFQVQNLCEPNIFLDSESFWTQNFVGLKICWTQNYVGPKIIRTNIFLDKKFLLTQKFVWTQKILDLKCTREWSLTLVLAQLVCSLKS